jgi:hypothetical protein
MPLGRMTMTLGRMTLSANDILYNETEQTQRGGTQHYTILSVAFYWYVKCCYAG